MKRINIESLQKDSCTAWKTNCTLFLRHDKFYFTISGPSVVSRPETSSRRDRDETDSMTVLVSAVTLSLGLLVRIR